MNVFWREIVNGANVDYAEIEDYLDEKIKVMPQCIGLNLAGSHGRVIL